MDDLDPLEVEEAWVRIQKETFANWINDKLQGDEVVVKDLRVDLRDGVMLCKLMVELKGEKIGRIKEKKNLNHYEAGGNLQLAMQAMERDDIRLVNIGAEDISGGNVKLVLGLCWLLVRRYQIGARSRLSTKKIMLAWINAALYPDLQVTNFSSDWNDGVALHGLIDYCKPGSASDWKKMDHLDRVKNCSEALALANQLFGIPPVVSAENMASSDLDDLSGMTYLSYFLSEGGPGYKATLQWVKDTVSPQPVQDFTTSWGDGSTMVSLVLALGCDLPDLSSSKPEARCSIALAAGQKQFHIPAFITSRDLFPLNSDHIGLLAHTAWLQVLSGHRPPEQPPEQPSEQPPEQPSEQPPEQPSEQPPEQPSEQPPEQHSEEPFEQLLEQPHGTPDLQEQEVEEEPFTLSHTDDVTVVIKSEGAIHSTMAISIKTSDPSETEFKVVASSPSGTETQLPVTRTGPSVCDVTFTPSEKGDWTIWMSDACDVPVTGSPFYLKCYDVTKAEIEQSREGPIQTYAPYSFHVQTAEVNSDMVRAQILRRKEPVPVEVTPAGSHRFKVTFTPLLAGRYLSSVYVGGSEIPGSPFSVLAESKGDVTVSGDGIRFGIQQHLSTFKIESSGIQSKNVDLSITDPQGLQVSTECRKSRSGHLMTVSFLPNVSGTFKIDVTYNDQSVPGSPFYPEVTAAHVYVHGLEQDVVIGETSSFTVDASEMSTGTLEIDSDLPVLSYEKEGEKKYCVIFAPKVLGKHDLLVKYNEILVADSPYVVNVIKG